MNAYIIELYRNDEPFMTGEYSTEEQAMAALEALLYQYGKAISYTLLQA